MRLGHRLDEIALRDRYPFARLWRSIGTPVKGDIEIPESEPTAPDFSIRVAELGNLTPIFPHVSSRYGTDARDEPLGGAGADVDPELAWLRAVVEAAERYASMAADDRDFTVASAHELGSVAMDLDRVPRLSDREYADPKCPLRRPDKAAPIRWARGYSLVDRCERWVPAVMACLYVSPTPAEWFWSQISTGIAAHTRLTAALISAICENIERDAIALTWLARLPLPRIDVGAPPPPALAANLRVLDRGLVRHHLFDATTDLGIPTAYAIQLLDGHPKLSQYVNCATDLSAAAACAKTMREAAPGRTVFQLPRSVPDDVNEFTSLFDGATLLGRPEHRGEFEFLLSTPHRRPLRDVGIEPPAGEPERLRFLLGRLAALGMDAIAVDLTTDELRDVGLWAVRVVTPDLMPMSVTHRARYLGHPRLYEYPEKAGFGKLTEDRINPAPQPFA
jgi:ribosomal protein S12 methylthiotransferase accessory factor